MSQSEMEKLYEAYLKNSDRTIEIEGVVFFEIIDKRTLCLEKATKMLPEKKCCIARVPWEIGGKINDVYIDEKGKAYTLTGIEHCCFRGSVPDWYLETGGFLFHGIESEEMGDYLALQENYQSQH